MNLVGQADEHHSAEDKVDPDGQSLEQDQDALGVFGQPDVVLADEQLQGDVPEPGEAGAVVAAQVVRWRGSEKYQKI